MVNIEEIIGKYYDDNDELKSLLLHHSRQVADKAMEVVGKHPELEVDKEFVREAALLHDIGIVYTDAPGIGCKGSHPYICHGMLGAQMLRNEGLPRHARVAERHTGTGLTLETIQKQGLPLPQNDFLPETMEEQIVCYADKFFSKSSPERVKTEEQVRQMLSRFPDANIEQWDKWHRLFG